MVAQGAGEFETVGFPQVLPSLFRLAMQGNGPCRLACRLVLL